MLLQNRIRRHRHRYRKGLIEPQREQRLNRKPVPNESMPNGAAIR